MDRGNHRLGTVFDDVEYRVQAGLLRWLAEFGNIGAGEEGAAAADQDDRLDAIVLRKFAEARIERQARLDAQSIDRGVVDFDHPDAAVLDAVFSDFAHERLLDLQSMFASVFALTRRATQPEKEDIVIQVHFRMRGRRFGACKGPKATKVPQDTGCNVTLRRRSTCRRQGGPAAPSSGRAKRL